VALALAAGALWAGYIVLGHRVAADPGIRPQDGLATGMAIGALVLAPFLVGPATPALTDPSLLAACVAVGLASSVVPYGLEQLAMRRLPRARFALLLSLLPATAALVGAVILGQVPSALEAAGWERIGRGSTWYSLRFIWRREGAPPEHVALATDEAETATLGGRERLGLEDLRQLRLQADRRELPGIATDLVDADRRDHLLDPLAERGADVADVPLVLLDADHLEHHVGADPVGAEPEREDHVVDVPDRR